MALWAGPSGLQVRKVYPPGKPLAQHKKITWSRIRVRKMNDDHHRTEITMDQQPGQEDGEDADQNRDPESSGAPVPDPAPAGPDSRLAEFAWDDSREAPKP